MSTLTTHSAQEISALYGQLSQNKQNEVFVYLRTLVEQEQLSSSSKNVQNDALESFIGCAAGEVKNTLSIEEMNEIIADTWANRSSQG